jgi:adenosine deaminase
LLEEVVAQGVPLEMCITSNVHTHAVHAVSDHPLRRYLERGVRVTLNTDGRLMDGISLTDEQYLAHTVLGVRREELARMTLNACEAAFLPESEKVALVARMQSELEAVG